MSIRWPTRYEWALASGWVDGLRESFSAQVRVDAVELEQPYAGTVMIQVGIGGRWHDVAIDYFDEDRLLDEVLQRCPLVFKMQHRRDGYGLANVVPGGYVPGRPHFERLVAGLRHERDARPPRFDVYGRFGTGFGPDLRCTAVRALRHQARFGFEGGMRLLPYPAYLREAARSKVCIDMPGKGDLCHRLVDYLGIGCCVVRPEPTVRLHVPLQSGRDIIFVHDVQSGLVDACERLLHEPRTIDAIAGRARRFFDRYLQADQLAGYYLDQCLKALGAPGGASPRRPLESAEMLDREQVVHGSRGE